MPVTLTPHDEDKTIFIYRCEGNWTWEQLGKVDNRVWDQYHESESRFDVIVDMTKSNTVPLGVIGLIHRVGQRHPRPMQELGIFVKAPLSVQIVFHALKRMYPGKSRTYVFVKTFDEALAMIEQDRKK